MKTLKAWLAGILMSVFGAVPALADVAYDTPTGFDAGSTNTVHTFSHTTGAGSNRVLYVVVHTRAATPVTVSAASYNSVALTSVVGCTNTEIRTEIWRLVAPTTGANTVSITLSATDDISAEAISASGADQTTPEEDSDSLCTDASSSSLTLTSGSTGACVDGMSVNSGVTALAPGANQTSRNLVEGNNSLDADASTELAQTNCVMTWTWTGGFQDRSHVAVAIRVAAVVTAFPAHYYQMLRQQ